MNLISLKSILLTLVFNIFLSNASIITYGNGILIHYNFHCYNDYDEICENYEDSLNFVINTYNNENSLLKNVYFEIFVDNLNDNGIIQNNHVVNLDSQFQRFSSKEKYPNFEGMSKMINNDKAIDVIMIFDNFKYKQDELNSIEFSLSDMIDDNLIQVLSGLGAYDDGNYFGNIDDKTPKEFPLSKLNYVTMNNVFTRNIFQKVMNVSNENVMYYLFLNEEALSSYVWEKYPWDDTLFYKEGSDRTGSISNRTLTGNYDRIISFGDIHGDYNKLIKVLTAANLIDKRKNWIAKNTALVQIGDLIDRGRDSKKILNLMIRLRKQAPNYDSDVFMILGNHETMNIGGRYDYVTVSELATYRTLYIREKQFSFHERYGSLIRKEMNATMIVGDTLFVHAGLLSYHLNGMTLDDINRHFHNILSNALTHPSVLTEDEMYQKPVFTDPYFDDDGPTWTRTLFNGPETPICEDLYKTLKITNTNRMVVGHTVQQDGMIHTRCNNRLYFIDVGMSRAYLNTLAYLEFKKDEKEIWARYS